MPPQYWYRVSSLLVKKSKNEVACMRGMFYVFVVTEGDVLDGSGLEPRAGVSKFVGDDSHTVEV